MAKQAGRYPAPVISGTGPEMLREVKTLLSGRVFFAPAHDFCCTDRMRIAGIILIVVGVLMFIFSGINFQTEKTVVDVGPLKVQKKENNHIGWPVCTGAIVVVAGIALLVAGRKNA